MTTLRSRAIGWLGRRYLARKQKKGFDLASISFLPDAALMPLKRDGLDPVPELAATREHEPITRLPLPFGMKAWLVTGYDEAKAVLGHATGYSNDFGNLVGSAGVTADQNPGGLGMSDPPGHTRLRRILTPEFTMRRLARLTPRISEIVTEQLDTMATADGPVDLAQAFAFPIPSLTICELLGVPYAERGDFQRLSTARFDLFGGTGASLGAITESLTYLTDVVRRQRDNPGDGLLGMLVKEHGDTIEDRELAGLADGLLTGGLETTASMLTLGALVLLSDPDTFGLIHDDDTAIDPFVEELLRYLTVVQVAFPGSPARTSTSPATPSARATSSWSPCPAPTATPPSAPTWNTSTPPEPPSRTSRSATASTAASAPNWPAWNSAPPTPRYCAATRNSTWPSHPNS